LPGLNARERRKTLWKDRKEVLNPIGTRPNDQHGNSFGRQILLVGEVLVERQQKSNSGSASASNSPFFLPDR